VLTERKPIVFSDIAAEQKQNYSLADTRDCIGNIEQTDSGKIFIGRGLEVWNLSKNLQ